VRYGKSALDRSPRSALARHGGIGALVAVGLLGAYYAIPFVVAVASLGEICPYSPSGTKFCGSRGGPAVTTQTLSGPELRHAKRLLGGKLCKQRGTRFVGAAENGVRVCFTISRDRRRVEMGFSFVAASGCQADSGTASRDVPGTVDRSGHFEDSDGNAITIRGDSATGMFVDSYVCPGEEFDWTAHRTP
jgi:hypothetical protein